MPNANSLRVPKYGKHKATGQARVQIGGRTLYLGRYGSEESHEAYKRAIAEWGQRGLAPPPPIERPTTVSDVMLAYLRFAKDYYRKHGKVTREFEIIRDCCKLIQPLYGRTPAAAFGPLRLKTIRQAMIDGGHSRKYITNTRPN